MSKSNLDTSQSKVSTKENEVSLKGTFVFVMFIGSFILVTWFAIYFLFLSRI